MWSLDLRQPVVTLLVIAALLSTAAGASCRLRRRSYSGRCTNTAKPHWGTAGLAQTAYFGPSNVTTPTGTDLPSARVLSNILSPARPASASTPVSDVRATEFSVFFSQFLDHDLLAVLDNPDDPLPIAADPHDQTRSRTAPLKFLRSRRARPGVASERPLNSASGPIDLSTVYGSDRARAKLLRKFEGGLLRHSPHDLLPLNEFAVRNAPNASSRAFFLSGDHRANEHPMLTALHVLFSREHNRLAREIAAAKPTWSDARLFAAARAVNIAQMQAVVYEEFLPAMLGRGRDGGAPLPAYDGFDPHAKPAASMLFGSAAFRVGHSMVSATFARALPSGRMRESSLFHSFFRPAAEFEGRGDGGVEPLLRAATRRAARNVDLAVVPALRDALFRDVPGMHEFDLMALNIQRGRDHGLPSYNAARRHFGLPVARSFADLTRSAAMRRRLRAAYGAVDRVEAWVGMLAEPHVPGAAVGPLVRAVWVREFARLRDGDARFYKRARALDVFNVGSIASVRRLRAGLFGMRRLLVDNSRLRDDELPRDLWRAARR